MKQRQLFLELNRTSLKTAQKLQFLYLSIWLSAHVGILVSDFREFFWKKIFWDVDFQCVKVNFLCQLFTQCWCENLG